MRIKINNQFINFFDNLTINLSLDSFASPFSFVTRFDPDNETHKQLFKPLSFNRVQIYNNDNKLLLDGVAINHSKKSSSGTQLLNISGYSKAGILEDVNIPVSAYPLEKNNVNLNEITDSLIGIFGLKKIVESSAANDMSLNYEKTKASPTETIKSYLSKLANQRNIIISHNQNGDLVFFKGSADLKPKKAYNQSNVLSMDLQVRGQAMHDEISVIRQPSDNNDGVSTEDTVNNRLINIKRSTVKVLSSGEDTDTSKAANNILAAELENISLSINLHKIDSDLRPGDVISVENKEIFLYKPTKFLITSIGINKKADSETMSLSCLLPEVLTGESPDKIFD